MTATRDDLFALFSELGIETRTLAHAAAFTVGESRLLEKDLPGGHTKNLFLKCKKGRIFLIVTLNDAIVNLKTLHKRLGCGRLSFGNPELMMELLGVTPGSVTPFALVNDRDARINVILDATMMACAQLNYHPLINTETTSIARDDLLRFIRSTGHEPEIMDVCDLGVSAAANTDAAHGASNQ